MKFLHIWKMVVQFLVLMYKESERERNFSTVSRRCSISFWLVYFHHPSHPGMCVVQVFDVFQINKQVKQQEQQQTRCTLKKKKVNTCSVLPNVQIFKEKKNGKHYINVIHWIQQNKTKQNRIECFYTKLM